MKLLVMLETAQVYTLPRPTKEISDIMESERCLIIDTSRLTFWDPLLEDEAQDIESVNTLLGAEEDMDEDEAYSEEEAEDEEQEDYESYDDDVNYN